jgi:serine phosphatase RsbU (regulator of sigma subunit)
MLVSVAIGALRREKSSSPAAILAGLNEALLGQGGFVTCCCIRYAPGGELTVASAGHPAPYCEGREVEVSSGLPLGVVAETEWQETGILLQPGSQVTLVSDGVVEAENAKRELFGFDRTREISKESAQQIADTARAWGQNDDITVVTVGRNS